MASRASDRGPDRILALLDRIDDESDLAAIESMPTETAETAAVFALRRLATLECNPGEASRTLRAALRQKIALEGVLGRKVKFRFALFDLLVNVQKRIASPMIVELPHFEGLQRSAVTDHLTGASNRSYLDARLESEIRRARRYAEHLSLLLLDLDDFKEINDTRGHLVGDRVLREVGRLVLSTVRDVDIAARYGGEEFAVVLPETPKRGALVVAERIRSEVERCFKKRGDFGRAVRLTLCGGLASYPEDAEEPSSLIAKADRALYRAKRSGKNRIIVYYEEKRRAERYGVEERRLKVSLRSEGDAGSVKQVGRVKNISEGGLLVELPEPVPIGSQVQVTFSLGHDSAYSFPSTVVRLEEFEFEGKRRRFDAGLRFERRARVLQSALSRLARQQLAAG